MIYLMIDIISDKGNNDICQLRFSTWRSSKCRMAHVSQNPWKPVADDKNACATDLSSLHTYRLGPLGSLSEKTCGECQKIEDMRWNAQETYGSEAAQSIMR